ncbi:cytidine deaminase [Anditalea andensis]|uniref:Cytidine deaminase n=1 Tax=Anditalea andensis TaxID=1048983 RepID=A0A074KZT0_9BACT|nr:cytidine deaminase [Anditalea andensis]KEO73710.1 cytidine deaminase [Anditalea andensis]
MINKIQKTVTLKVFHWDQLDEEIKTLIYMARSASSQAYAPYSNFMVGAALLLDNGEILSGNNQENVSFPVGICAERVVLGYAHARYPKSKPLKLAVAAKRRNEKNFAYVTPCGLCRQTISEYEQRYSEPIEIYMLAPNDEIYKVDSIDELLPFKFNDLNG